MNSKWLKLIVIIGIGLPILSSCTGEQRSTYFIVNRWIVDDIEQIEYQSQEEFEQFKKDVAEVKEEWRLNFKQNKNFTAIWEGGEHAGIYRFSEDGSKVYFEQSNFAFDSLYIMEIGNDVLFLETITEDPALIYKLIPNEKLY